MYGRGVRLLTQPALSTAPGVGPGTYRVDDGRHAGESYAPFCSMAVRESFLTVDQQLATAPGPAHYTPDLVEDHVKGGDSLKSKAERFRDKLSRTPGPGTYSVSKRSDWLRKTYPPPSHGEQLFQTAGMIKSGRLLFTRKLTAPSIPTPGQSYGYDEAGDGNLTPQPLPAQDSTMGPAYYNVSHDETVTTKKYKGVNFGNQKSLRTQFKGREGPGPGDYHSLTADSDSAAPPPPPQNKTTTSQSLPRYHIIVTRQEEKKAVPGPGKYEIRSQFRKSPSAEERGGIEDERNEEADQDILDKAPFGSREKRFMDPKHHSPACTTYQEPSSAFTHSLMGHERAPFGQTSSRFRRNRKDKEIPGPGSYNNNQMTSLVADLSRRSQFHGTYKCPFGTTSVRTAPLIKKDVILGPGPAHYQQSEQQRDKSGETSGRSQQEETRVTRPSYTFASTTSRLYSPPSIVTDIPPPGSYEVSESYSRSQDRAPSRVAKRAVRGAFLSSSARSAPPRDIMLEEPDGMNPGPGEYNHQDPLGKGKPGLLCHKDLRFKPIDNKVPGPGAYTLSKAYKDTVLQGTYNASLSNPLTPSPGDTHPYEKMNKKQTLVLET